MKIEILKNKKEVGKKAAKHTSRILRETINKKGEAVFVAATGASQFEFLEFLTNEENIDWAKTIMFHLDEYVGIPVEHPASFRKYLKERLVDRVHPGTVHFIKGDAEDIEAECERLNKIIRRREIDVAFVGIGENGHLAFNDPPADFDTEKPYIIVELDKDCRKQQVGEGWFKSVDQVPRKAISMSIQQIMKSNEIICTVPEKRKAKAVKECFEGDISPMCPASILRKHENTTVYLDKASASLLSRQHDT